jgi:hypothetical protein
MCNSYDFKSSGDMECSICSVSSDVRNQLEKPARNWTPSHKLHASMNMIYNQIKNIALHSLIHQLRIPHGIQEHNAVSLAQGHERPRAF